MLYWNYNWKLKNSSNNFLFLSLFFFLKKYFYGMLLRTNSLYLYMKPNNLLYVLTYFKRNFFLRFNYLSDLTAVDNISNGFYRFELIYVFWNLNYNLRIYIKIFTNGLQSIPSINSIYPNSNWLEREVWDMFGLKFIFNNDLRRILTDYGFKGHPLRKDFPLVGFIELRYSNVTHGLYVKPVKIMQNIRFFKYDNPWLDVS